MVNNSEPSEYRNSLRQQLIDELRKPFRKYSSDFPNQEIPKTHLARSWFARNYGAGGGWDYKVTSVYSGRTKDGKAILCTIEVQHTEFATRGSLGGHGTNKFENLPYIDSEANLADLLIKF